MNTGQEIIDFSKAVLEHVSKIDDAIDKILEPITDYTDTLEDIATPIKAVVGIINLRRKLILKSFIANYAYQLYNNYEIDKKETDKLQLFFRNKKNIAYLSEIIDNAMNAKSLKSTAILGVIAGKIIKEKKELDYKLSSIIDTLRIMTDIDIENFVTLYEYIDSLGFINDQTREFRTFDFYKDEHDAKILIDKLSLELTIEKLKRTNGLTYSVGGVGFVGNAKGAFVINEITKELYLLIKRTKTIE